MRFLLYAAKLYEKYIAGSDYYPYSSVLQPAPHPKCVCFYNGTGNQPERKILRLSEAFGGEGVEVLVTMLNINYGKNKALMAACELVETIRRNQRTMRNLEATIDAAINEMPDEFMIKKFLLQNKAEVKGMFLTEYDQEKVLAQERQEVEYRVATDMLMDNYPLSAISKISRLSEDTIRTLANSLGMSVNGTTAIIH